jgi:RimJ/RimL family protein N-acetyltransferase
MQKLGMQQEGIERDSAMKRGRYESMVRYAILEHEWKAKRK